MTVFPPQTLNKNLVNIVKAYLKKKRSEGIIALKNTIVSISKSSIPYEQKFSDSCVFVLRQVKKQMAKFLLVLL